MQVTLRNVGGKVEEKIIWNWSTTDNTGHSKLFPIELEE